MLIQSKKIKSAFVAMALLVSNCCVAQFGGTMTFDGTQQSIGTPNGMMNGVSVFTIEFWIKTTENRTNGTYWQRPTMLGVATNGNASGDFGITSNNGYIGMFNGLNNAGDNDFLSSTTQINDNNWHHIAVTDNNAQLKIYVDGTLQGTLAANIGFQTNTAPLTIGASALDFNFSGNVGINNFFHAGIYDEVRFSNVVRYAGNFTVPTAAFTSDANTVALYHFDAGCVSGKVPDASSNANNGMPHNFTGSCAFTLPPTPNIPANNAVANINKAEYFYDTDPGLGNGTNIPVTVATDITQVTNVNTGALPNGVHRLYVRTRDVSNRWSLTNYTTFFIVPPVTTIPATKPLSRILKAEYFYDTDPGFGNATNIPVSASYDLSGSFTVNTSSLSNGVHRIYVRTQDSVKNWSLTNLATFYVLPPITTIPANPGLSNIVKAEYYMDTDPGFGNGTNIPMTASNDVTINNAFVNLTGLSNGVHRVYVRTKNAAGSWSLTNHGVFNIIAASFSLPPNPAPANISSFEYFFDTDPGFGNGTKVTIAPTTDLNNYSFVANVSALNDSTHTLYIRSYGVWSITNTRSFVKGTVTPVTWLSFNARAVADSVLLDWQTASETNNARFDIERSADGRSFTKVGSIAGSGTSSITHAYRFTDNSPLQGISYYRIKQTDFDGRSKYSVVVAVRFEKNGYVIAYPNPADQSINVVITQQQLNKAKLQLIDMSGRLVKMETVLGSTTKLDLSTLANGVYQLLLITDKIISSQKITVKH